MSSRVRALTQPTVSNLKTWQRFGNVKRRKRCKTGRQGAGKYQANQQDSDLSPDSGSAYRGSNPCLPATHLGSATRARGQLQVSRGDLQLKVGSVQEKVRENRDRALL